MPLEEIPVGGKHYSEYQLLNILRTRVADPGMDDPNAKNGSGHAARRDADYKYSPTGDGTTDTFTITPPVAGAPVVCVHDVTVGGTPLRYGWDYIVHWGDQFGTPDQQATKIQFLTTPTLSAAIVIPCRYGLRVTAPDNKSQAFGSFIAGGFSRGAMPLPKIKVLVEMDDFESVGVGDNFDDALRMGNMWHNMQFRITVMSLYADECKDLADTVASAINVASHDDNYLMPILKMERILNMDYDIDQKAYVHIVQCSAKAREIFG